MAESPFEPQEARTARFLAAAEVAGLVKASKRAGTFKAKGKGVLDPNKLVADFAGVEAATGSYRKVLDEAHEGPEVVRAALAPAVEKAAARKALGKAPTATTATVLVGSFRVSVRYHGERQALRVVMVDLADGKLRPDLHASLEAAVGAESEALALAAEHEKVLPRALDKLREQALEEARLLGRTVHDEVARIRADRRAMMEGYFAGLDEEYEKEERRLHYHLYYFDRAERLEARRKADLSERKSLLEDEGRYYDVDTTISPVGIALLSFPLWEAEGKVLCALRGELL